MKLDRKQLAEKLNVKLDGLKTIERRKQLRKRLKDINLKFVKKIKEGKTSYYIIEEIKDSKTKVLVNSICRHVFATNRPKEFSNYFRERTEKSKNNIPVSLEQLSQKNNIGISTIYKWDLKLLDKKIISKDGYFYFRIDKTNYTVEQVTQEEYKNFWKNKGEFLSKQKIQEKFNEGKLSFQDAMDLVESMAALRMAIDDKYFFKVKKYKLNEDNLLYSDFLNLIS
jgi:hypothetical protein